MDYELLNDLTSIQLKAAAEQIGLPLSPRARKEDIIRMIKRTGMDVDLDALPSTGKRGRKSLQKEDGDEEMNYIAPDEADAIIISPEEGESVYIPPEKATQLRQTQEAPLPYAHVRSSSQAGSVQPVARNVLRPEAQHVARPVDIIKNNTTAPQEKGRSMKEDPMLRSASSIQEPAFDTMPHLSPEQAAQAARDAVLLPKVKEMPQVNAEDVIEMLREQDLSQVTGVNPAVPELLDQGGCGIAEGILEVQEGGFGYLRALHHGQKDCYISIAQIRRFGLRNGDHIKGVTRPEKEGGEKYLAMLYITDINGDPPEVVVKRKQFDELTPIYPMERLTLERPDQPDDLAIRLLDLVAPVGRGQRGLIVSPPKAGKTTILKKIAGSIATNYPDIELMVLLIDERPEEVTDMQRSINGEVIYSTFDEQPENHCRVAEQVLDRAKRLVEHDRHVVILMDSITRLARANNQVVPTSGRLLSGGLDPAALYLPKRFFGAARNIENGGSLTILATALVDTGSRLDDIIYEEFKSTGNMELHLDRRLQERRVFPAIDFYRSGTRREEVLLSPSEMNAMWQIRKLLSGNTEDSTELLIDMMSKTSSNAEFVEKLSSWLAMMDSKPSFRTRG